MPPPLTPPHTRPKGARGGGEIYDHIYLKKELINNISKLTKILTCVDYTSIIKTKEEPRHFYRGSLIMLRCVRLEHHVDAGENLGQ